MISIVCVYNKKDVLNEFLIKSLKNQSAEYELILIDNTNGKFSSAAEALNEGGSKAKGDYIMFVHQDVDLKSDTWLEDAERMVNSLDNMGIAGVAGRSKDVECAATNIHDGIPPGPAGTEIEKSIEAQTLDECLLLIPMKVFNKFQFDGEVCDNWHLYAVDYSLSIKRSGYNVYVIPMFLYHRSKAYSFSHEYYVTLEKLLRKHSDFKVILTTVGDWITFVPVDLQVKFPWLKKRLVSLLKYTL